MSLSAAEHLIIDPPADSWINVKTDYKGDDPLVTPLPWGLCRKMVMAMTLFPCWDLCD